MDRTQAMVKVFQAIMTLPETQELVNSGKSIPAEVFLNKPVIAKAIFSGEPGCAVNYQAINAKIKVLEPHLKVSKSGPELLKFFDELRNQRNKWAVAFANYESHTIMTFGLEQQLYGRGLTPSERDMLNANRPELPVVTILNAAEKKLLDTKSTRQFAQNVRILEECTKRHKLHIQRKAHAEEAKRALAQKKRTQATKAKKAALAIPAISRQPGKSVFNPDLPDFAQFVSGYAAPESSRVVALGDSPAREIVQQTSPAYETMHQTGCHPQQSSGEALQTESFETVEQALTAYEEECHPQEWSGEALQTEQAQAVQQASLEDETECQPQESSGEALQTEPSETVQQDPGNCSIGEPQQTYCDNSVVMNLAGGDGGWMDSPPLNDGTSQFPTLQFPESADDQKFFDDLFGGCFN